MANALSRQPGEVGYPDEGSIVNPSSWLHALQDPVIFSAVADWLLVVAPHLVLTGCIEEIKTALSSGHPVVALACKRHRRQCFDYGEYTNWIYHTLVCWLWPQVGCCTISPRQPSSCTWMLAKG